MLPNCLALASKYVNAPKASRLQRSDRLPCFKLQCGSLPQASMWFITSIKTLACFQAALLHITSMLPKLQGFNASIGFKLSFIVVRERESGFHDPCEDSLLQITSCFLASRLQRFNFWRQREKETASLLQASLWFNLLQASIWFITSSKSLACFQTALLQNTSMLPKLQGFNASIGFLASSFNVVHWLKL